MRSYFLWIFRKKLIKVNNLFLCVITSLSANLSLSEQYWFQGKSHINWYPCINPPIVLSNGVECKILIPWHTCLLVLHPYPTENMPLPIHRKNKKQKVNWSTESITVLCCISLTQYFDQILDLFWVLHESVPNFACGLQFSQKILLCVLRFNSENRNKKQTNNQHCFLTKLKATYFRALRKASHVI